MKMAHGTLSLALGAWCMVHGAAQTQTETIALGVGSDQCLSEPTDLVQNRLVGAVQTWEVKDLTSLPPVEPGEFTYAVFGDTQNYHMQGDVYTNQSFSTRVDWLIGEETVRLQNIRFISHLGDVIDRSNDERQWALASNQVARLKDAGLPIMLLPGNHDMIWGDTTSFVRHLPQAWLESGLVKPGGNIKVIGAFEGFEGLRYSDNPKIGTRYSDREADDAPVIGDVGGLGANSYQLFDFVAPNGTTWPFIFIHLQCSTPKPVIDWVDGLLTTHSDRLAVIVNHEGLGLVNAKQPFEREEDRTNIGRMRCCRYTSNDSRSAQYQWERCYSRHPNVMMILSGHQIEGLSHVRTSRGLYGNDVVEILQNYPELPYSDWIRLYRINPVMGTIRCLTWSPQQGKLCEGNEDEFRPENNKKHESYLYATNCPHQFKIDFGRLRAGVRETPATRAFTTVTDTAATDGSLLNGRELDLNSYGWSGIASYPIVSRVELSKAGDEAVIRYYLCNDYTMNTKSGAKISILDVVNLRVLFEQGGECSEVTDLISGDVKVGGGGWYEVRAPLASVATRLGLSAGELTNVVATVATVPEGTAETPWTLGEGVTGYLANGVLHVEGAGAMDDFVCAADAPWACAAAHVRRVEVSPAVTHLAAHAFEGVPAGVPLSLTEAQVPRLIGAISPADPNAIEVVDGAVRLTVSVSTNSELTAATEGWGKAKVGHAETEDDGTVTLTVPAPAERGFMILKSKGK